MEKPKGKTKRRNQKEKLKGKINQRCQLLQCNVAMALSTGSQSTTFKILPKIPRTNSNMNTFFRKETPLRNVIIFYISFHKKINCREAGEECDCGSPERCLARRRFGSVYLVLSVYLCVQDTWFKM